MLARGSSHEYTGGTPHFLELCSYQRADLREDEDLVVVEEHVQIGAQIGLYPERADVPGPFSALPLRSEDLEDWYGPMYNRREFEAWREGCGKPLRVCAEGDDPTVQIAAHQNWFIGSVGNLTFDVAVTYLGERLPPDVEQRNLAILRDFVLAVIESKERVE